MNRLRWEQAPPCRVQVIEPAQDLVVAIFGGSEAKGEEKGEIRGKKHFPVEEKILSKGQIGLP